MQTIFKESDNIHNIKLVYVKVDVKFQINTATCTSLAKWVFSNKDSTKIYTTKKDWNSKFHFQPGRPGLYWRSFALSKSKDPRPLVKKKTRQSQDIGSSFRIASDLSSIVIDTDYLSILILNPLCFSSKLKKLFHVLDPGNKTSIDIKSYESVA